MTWTRWFVLEPAKLTRIHEILTERLQRGGRQIGLTYSTTRKKGLRANHADLGEVLTLDNTRQRPIESLTIRAETSNASPALNCVLQFTKDQKENVQLTTSGDDAIEVSETFAAIEEQVERTFSAMIVPLLAIIAGLLILIFGLLALERFDPWPIAGTGLRRADFIELDKQIDKVHGANDQLAFIYELHRREVQAVAEQLKPVQLRSLMTLSNLLNALVVAAVAFLLLYLGVFCYPRAVFAWGDVGEHYTVLKERRKTIRNVLLFVIVGGIIINLVSAGLWERYNRMRPPNEATQQH